MVRSSEHSNKTKSDATACLALVGARGIGVGLDLRLYLDPTRK